MKSPQRTQKVPTPSPLRAEKTIRKLMGESRAQVHCGANAAYTTTTDHSDTHHRICACLHARRVDKHIFRTFIIPHRPAQYARVHVTYKYTNAIWTPVCVIGMLFYWFLFVQNYYLFVLFVFLRHFKKKNSLTLLPRVNIRLGNRKSWPIL